MNRFLLCLLGCLLLTTGPTFADDDDHFKWLKGMRTVHLLIFCISPEREDAVRNFVEYSLRANGITISTTPNDSSPLLSIEVDIERKRLGLGEINTVRIKSECWETVTTQRPPNISGSARTWFYDASDVATDSGRDTDLAVDSLLQKVMSKFLNDYLKANPKT